MLYQSPRSVREIVIDAAEKRRMIRRSADLLDPLSPPRRVAEHLLGIINLLTETDNAPLALAAELWNLQSIPPFPLRLSSGTLIWLSIVSNACVGVFRLPTSFIVKKHRNCKKLPELDPDGPFRFVGERKKVS